MRCNTDFLYIFLFCSILAGCTDNGGISPDAYIGGKIVNSNVDFVVLSKDMELLDTIFLDQENRFGYRIENVEAGTYLLDHDIESQIIYISPGDSILMRANTMEFDESLHFSGIGGEKNNFLINMFLLNEDNTNLVLSYYEIDPKEFAKKTDSIRTERLETLEELHQKYRFPEGFLDLAKKIIDYEYYDLRERYTYMVNKYYRRFSDQFPEDFYDYRDKANFSDEDLQTISAYIRFISNYLINKSMTLCTEQKIEGSDCYNLNSIENIKSRIKLIDSLTSEPIIKRHFFSKLGALGMVMGKNRKELISVLELLQEKGINDEKLNELKQLGTIQFAFFPGVTIDEVPLITPSGETVGFSDISEKPVILNIWSIHSPRYHSQEHKIIADLRKKYPEIDFIGINIDIGETAEWEQAIRENNYDPEMEYQLGEIEIGKEPIDKDLFEYYLNKLLFLDATGKVIIGDAFINSPDFESRILEFLNR